MICEAIFIGCVFYGVHNNSIDQVLMFTFILVLNSFTIIKAAKDGDL